MSKNFTVTFHKYSIYLNTYRNTQYKVWALCKNLQSPIPGRNLAEFDLIFDLCEPMW